MRSKPKFLIFSLLSMYPKITLKDLSKITGKSKSTISVHLSDMENMGLVEVAGEKKARGSIPTKFFRLVSNYEEKMAEKCCKKEQDNISAAKQALQMQRSFAQTQVQMLQNWLKYLEQLDKDLDDEVAEGTSDTVLQEVQEIKHDTAKITIVSFYDEKNAKKFREGVLSIYNEAEDRNKNADNPDLVHPYYVGVQILPIKKAIDYFLDRKD